MVVGYNAGPGNLRRWLEASDHGGDPLLFHRKRAVGRRRGPMRRAGAVELLDLPHAARPADAVARRRCRRALAAIHVPGRCPNPGGRPMARIDESRPFIPVNIAVLTISDTRTAEDDRSGDTLADRAGGGGPPRGRPHHCQGRPAVDRRAAAPLHRRPRDRRGAGDRRHGRHSAATSRRRPLPRWWRRISPASASCSAGSATTRSAPRRSRAGPPPAWRRAPTSSPCPAAPSACKDAWDGILQYQLDYRHRALQLRRTDAPPARTRGGVRRQRGAPCRHRSSRDRPAGPIRDLSGRRGDGRETFPMPSWPRPSLRRPVGG